MRNNKIMYKLYKPNEKTVPMVIRKPSFPWLKDTFKSNYDQNKGLRQFTSWLR